MGGGRWVGFWRRMDLLVMVVVALFYGCFFPSIDCIILVLQVLLGTNT